MVPFNFTNRSPLISLNATVRVEFRDPAGNLIGTSSPIAVDASSNTFYQGEITGLVLASAVTTRTVQLKITFTTLSGSYASIVELVA